MVRGLEYTKTVYKTKMRAHGLSREAEECRKWCRKGLLFLQKRWEIKRANVRYKYIGFPKSLFTESMKYLIMIIFA